MSRFPYGYFGRTSSVPSYLTQPNGLNFSKSVGVPTSRLERVRTYLRDNGPRTKKEILRDVFGKSVGQYPHGVTMGWGTYMFGLGVKFGFFKKTRKNGTTYWSV